MQETPIKEDGGFEWVITESFDGKKFKRGAKSTQGQELIPCEYDVIYYRNHYFYAVQEKGESSLKALYSDTGSCIIPITEQANELLVMTPEVGSPFVLVQKGGKYGTYSLSGEEKIKIEYDNLFAHEGLFYTRNSDGEMTIVGSSGKTTNESSTDDLLADALLFFAEQFYWVDSISSNRKYVPECDNVWLAEEGDEHFLFEEYEDAVKCYKEAAAKGYDYAQFALGHCYEEGLGIAKDAKEAVKWYRKAAEQGFCQGQTKLGLCYHTGFGIVKDETEAVNWFRKAAEQGEEQGQFFLGSCYLNGTGVAPDINEAVKWLKKAADQGVKEAEETLNLIEDYHNLLNKKQK